MNFRTKRSTSTPRVGGSSNGQGQRKRNFRTQNIDVRKLVHEGKPLEKTAYNAINSFEDFPLYPKLKQNIHKAGYTHPTEIQEKSFYSIMNKEDIVGIATTGTGKTGAFLIPLINRLASSDQEPFRTLVMVPTRELALQVEESYNTLTRGMGMSIISLIGGQSVSNDLRRLRKPHSMVVGTPGRLTDLCRRGELDLSRVSVLVLDEFDRMLDMGFSKDVNFLTSMMKTRQQTLLFSATIDRTQQSLIASLMTDPLEVKVSNGATSAEHIKQDVVYANRDKKFDTLLEMVSNKEFEKVLVFAETKRNVGKLTQELRAVGLRVDEIHGDKTQGYRQKALQAFKSGKIRILVATDVASRGLDISDVTHVINYEMPQNYETYIHRIGRTGRAGKPGSAFTFVN